MMSYFNPLHWMRWFGQFAYFWAISIPWRSVTAGMPAFLLTVALLSLTYFAYSDGGSWRRNLLERKLVAAIQAEDYETADLLLRRQIEEGGQATKTLYLLAENRANLDKADEAKELMRSLVSSRRSDAAAYWLIKELYIGKSWPELEEEQRTEFGRLLNLIATARPADLGIKQLLADYLIASERYAEAIPYLRELTAEQPMRGLQAAVLARRIGDSAMADQLATVTLDTVSKTFREEPANPGLALAVVQNQVFLDRHADAVQTLADSIERMKTQEHRQALSQAMGDTIVAWITKIESQPNETPAERLRVLKMLQLALQYAPNNPHVLQLVADQVLRTIESTDEEVVTVRNALVSGSSPGIAHFVRGTASLIKGDAESAQRHLTLASKHLPNSAAILNNLAVALSQREDGDLEHALQLSEQAIASLTQPNPYFYETRGQILFRMKRYLDAIPDLERALAAKPLAAVAHQTLATCYEHLDEPELAKDHQEAADELAIDD